MKGRKRPIKANGLFSGTPHVGKRSRRDMLATRWLSFTIAARNPSHCRKELGLPSLQKCVVTFLVKVDLEFDLKFEISD